MASKGIKNKKALKQLVTDLETEYKNINEYALRYESYINEIEGASTDAGKGLWTGERARTWVLAAKADVARLKQLANRISDIQIFMKSFLMRVNNQ